MTEPVFYDALAVDALADRPLDPAVALRLLTDADVDLLPLVHAAYRVRLSRFGKTVQVHIINNSQNGNCPEDCSYCTQARTSTEDIESYPIKNDEEILEEARLAYEAGAHRYCMVFAGRGPNRQRTAHLARLIRQIKQRYPVEVCVSAGLLDDEKAAALAEAGLDRLNHNLNTARGHYPHICTTHTYDDRLRTLRAARDNGLQVCSGLIVGMGETAEQVVEVATTLRELEAESIPVNFLIPFEGTMPGDAALLTPAYCLRVLCLFRLMNPRSDVRIAAGRELHLRDLQAMALYPANSLFLDGYLNARGDGRRKTLQMIRDGGFEIVSDRPLDELIGKEDQRIAGELQPLSIKKTHADLHPALRV